MKSNRFLSFLLGVMPFGIIPVSNDSTEANFQLLGGAGQYALISRGCEGQVLEKHKIPFKEYGAAIDYKTASPVRLGVNSAYIFTREQYGSTYDPQTQRYVSGLRATEFFAVNPILNFEWEKFAIGGGYLWANDHLKADGNFEKGFPSFYLRFGNLRSVYVDASLMHTTPLLSGGYLKLGVGSNRDRRIGWWVGIGGMPYDKAGLITRTNIRLHRRVYLDALARIGASEGITEGAVSVGVTYKLKDKK